MTDNINSTIYNNEDIDLELIIKTLKRKKKFIIYFSSIITSFTIVYLNMIKPTWVGSFNIVVKEESKSDSGLGGLNRASLLFQGLDDSNKTQEFILKSPSVLMPVFEYMKKEYKKDGKTSLENVSYDFWLKNYLDIGFEKGTSVLKISLKDQDKDLILDTLTMISNKYKDYSKKDKEKTIAKTIKYLEDQKVLMTKRSNLSTKNLNKFSIENGLGNIDGFIALGEPNNFFNFNDFSMDNEFDKNNLRNQLMLQNMGINSDNIGQNFKIDNDKAGQRFQGQFKLLEKYESQYIDLSSKLKPSSKTLNSLKTKIDNLRSSLKRPNQILLKYRELKKQAQLNEGLLYRIEKNLESVKLEKIKTPDTWELISLPTLDKGRFFPKRIRLSILALFSSVILGSFLAIIKERISKTLFEKDAVDEKLNCQYLDTLYNSNYDLSLKTFKYHIQTYIEDDSKVGILNYKNDGNFEIVEKFLDNFKSFMKVDFSNEENINKCDKLILIIESNKITTNQISLINKYLKFYDNKFIGWFYIEENINSL